MAPDLVTSITVFVLATFVGFEVIAKVPPTLHTPLMSGANAISGITLIGAVTAAGVEQEALAIVLGAFAVVAATVNVVGGFLVTDRMLSMFVGRGSAEAPARVSRDAKFRTERRR
ncbi:MAG TPA: NAD(P) transhydrogenase subunit alpha [Euzebyales bacterium]|nr:NAD(P) transhydrogenase subunit alpha [Euzebyales bacterium]